MGRRYSQEEVIKQFKNIHGDRYDYSKVEYINDTTNVTIICPIEGHGCFQAMPKRHKRGANCPYCTNKMVSKTNSIRSISPELIKYLKYEEDSDKISHGSGKKVHVICPNCKYEDYISWHKVYSNNGFVCEICSDGVSIPEKFAANILQQINVTFKKQKIFKWAKNKKYDFWIENKNMIIEVHGGQHYESTRNHFIRDLTKEKENDAIKEHLAKENGIKHYIVVDCRKSDFEWLKESFIKEFSPYFNLENINWKNVWENCQSSLKSKVWDLWNSRKESDTTKVIGDILGLTTATVIRYLKDGEMFNRCEYNPVHEKFKVNSKNGKLSAKTVYQYSKNGEFIKKWDSITDIYKNTGVQISNISKCCNGALKHAGGFVWSFDLMQDECNEMDSKIGEFEIRR
jgi:hypothetical protein